MNIPPSKCSIQHEIETFFEINGMYQKSRKKHQELSDTLGNYVKETLKSVGLPISQNLTGIQVCGLSYGPEREPEMWLYHSGYPCVNYIGNGKFVVTDSNNSGAIYSNEIVDMELPFDGEKILNLCEQLTEQLGIAVKFVETKVIDVVDEVREYRQLHLAHKTGTIIDSGEIQYKGWDCTDDWAVVDDVDGRHFYCGTSAHGGGYTYHILPGEDYSEIKAFLRSADVFASEDVFSYFPE
jgi:hypothetical protein